MTDTTSTNGNRRGARRPDAGATATRPEPAIAAPSAMAEADCRPAVRRRQQTSSRRSAPSARARRHAPSFHAHAQGLRVRPGGPLVPGLRRLLDPRPDPEDHARLRVPEGEHRLHLRHRLLRPPAVLHEHVRLPHHPRPRADARHGPQGRAPGPDGLGHHRRRRRALHRRQPRDPLDAPQRRHQADHVQQPHLRPDQGPGVADVRVRQEDQVHAGGHGRLADHAAVGRAGRRGDLRRPLGRHPHRAPPADARPGRPPQGLGVRGGPPELQHLQRRRLARRSPTARSATTGCSSWSTASR